MTRSFAEMYEYGRAGESLVVQWLKSHGCNVFPACDTVIQTHTAPMFANSGKAIIAPDLLVFDAKEIRWVEVKTKTAFTWHRISRPPRWTTGIDLRNYEHYQRIAKESPIPLWLFFVQSSGVAKDTPKGRVSPSGLYAKDLDLLMLNENHRHDESGMVYWAEHTLTKLAEWDELDTRRLSVTMPVNQRSSTQTIDHAPTFNKTQTSLPQQLGFDLSVSSAGWDR